jgi:enoyl-CoA hydratase/carnithine racemase
MEYKQIKYEINEHVLTITLNRPEKLNAFTDFVMVPELLDAFERADEDDDVRAVIVTGAGRGFCIVTGAGRGFCSGHDLNDGFDYNEQTEDSIDTHRDSGGVISLRIYEMKKPMIAAINGAAIGVGHQWSRYRRRHNHGAAHGYPAGIGKGEIRFCFYKDGDYP